MSDALVERLAGVVIAAQCAACGHEAGEHSWYGPCLVNVGNYDDACPCQHSREQVYARALLPVVEQEIAAARAEHGERIADLIVYDLARHGDFMTPSERKGQRRAARIARTSAQTPAAEEPHPTCAHCGHVRGLHGRNHGCISAFPDGRSGGSCGCPGYVTPATSPEEGR